MEQYEKVVSKVITAYYKKISKKAQDQINRQGKKHTEEQGSNKENVC